MKVFLISGWKKSGKDTVADYLTKHYGFNKYAIATSMKQMVSKMYNLPLESFYNQESKELPLIKMPVEPKDSFNEAIHELLKDEFADINGKKYWSPRSLMTLEGSIKRSVNHNYWTKQVIDDIDFHSTCDRNGPNDKKYVISDVRFKAELESLFQVYGDDLVTIRINRFHSSPTTDPSERDLDTTDFDIYIENKGDLDELYRDIDKIMLLEDIQKK